MKNLIVLVTLFLSFSGTTHTTNNIQFLDSFKSSNINGFIDENKIDGPGLYWMNRNLSIIELNCDDCEIWDLFAEAHEPDDNCEFLVDIEFNAENTCSDSFYVLVNGDEHCCWEYGEDYYTIGPFHTDEGVLEITVVDLENDDCRSEVFELEAPECDNCDDCEIWDLLAEAHEPDDNCEFLVDIEFKSENTCSDSFYVLVNGEEYCCWAYGEDFYTIGPFHTDEGVLEITVVDLENDDCRSEVFELEAPECDNCDDCEIWDLFAEAHRPDDNCEFLVDIEFNAENTCSDSFYVLVNGEEYCCWEYGEDFYTIGPFHTDEGVLEITVVDLENDNCRSEVFELEAPECENCDDCEIWDLFVEAHEPDDNCEFFVDIEFRAENTCSDSFYVLVNGEEYCCWEYGEDFYTIGPFHTDEGVLEITVVDLENDDCRSNVFALQAPECESSCDDCEIRDLFAEAHEPDDNCEFFVDIEFRAENTCSDSFYVLVNGDEYCCWAYGEDFYTIGPFHTDDGVLEITVVDLENDDCRSEVFELEAPECDNCDDCEIWDLLAEAHDPDDNCEFYVDIEFNAENTCSDSFYVLVNGDEYCCWAYGEDFYTIGPFHTDDGVLEITVVDLENDDCRSEEFRLEAPDCETDNCDDCEIWDLFAEAHEPDDNCEFYVDIEFNAENTCSDSFYVLINGEEYCCWAYGEDFYTIGPFHTDEGVLEITVVDLENDDCRSEEFRLEAPDCEIDNCDDCEIWDLFSEAHEPDDNCEFYVDIEFKAENTCSDSFYVLVNGEEYCCWAYGEDFYTIGPFHTDEGVLEITVVDLEIDDCRSEEFRLEAPDCETGNCDDCEIWDLIAEAHEPDDNCEFYVDIEFKAENTCSDSFYVLVNGEEYCCWAYGEDFYTIGPFHTDEGVLEITVVDLENDDCRSEEFRLEAPECEAGICNIWDLDVVVGEIISDSSYYIGIDFKYINTESEGFNLYWNHSFYGFYSYTELVLSIPVVTGGSEWEHLRVSDHGNPDCFDEIEFRSPVWTSLYEIEVEQLIELSNSSIKIISDQVRKVECYDVLGRKHGEIREREDSFNFEQSILNSGVYYFRITDLNGNKLAVPLSIIK